MELRRMFASWALTLFCFVLFCLVFSTSHDTSLLPGLVCESESLTGSFQSRYLPCGAAVSKFYVELAPSLLGLLSEALIGNSLLRYLPRGAAVSGLHVKLFDSFCAFLRFRFVVW